MNPDLNKLQPYPFEKLARLNAGVTPPPDKTAIALAIGEPQHATPTLISDELVSHLHGLATYPTTRGMSLLRETIAQWLIKRFDLATRSIHPDRNILPVSGTREALFSFAQAVIDPSTQPLVVMPNPFYQIYEGAAFLAGAQPWFLNATADNDFVPDFEQVPTDVWRRCQLIYICSPGNPTGAVVGIAALQRLIQLSDEYDFVIAADECYSEIYPGQHAPVGLLQAASAMGRDDYARCVVFHSLSKRSNVPGLRSGFVAGDAAILQQFLLYRTYHGCAMPLPTQYASIKAWTDERHVQENRDLYQEKFAAVVPILSSVLKVAQPHASFYLWPKTPIDDSVFVRELYRQQHVLVLPGSFLSRAAHGINPGSGYVRMALVPPLQTCIEAAHRIRDFVKNL